MTSTQEPPSDVEEVKKNLFKSAMKGVWKEVINIYRQNESLHKGKITRSGDTALHIAVSNGKESIVETLVGTISSIADQKEALKIGNERGDTPLHLAAAIGSVRICKYIAKKDPELIGARNSDQETPLYVAVLNGKKDAFYCLQKIIGPKKGFSYCRRGKDGDTILTSAINGFHFDLAFQIIHIHPELVDYVNQNGLSPLHVLASKPSAFKSGSRLRWYHKIINICTFVRKLREQKVEETDLSISQRQTDDEGEEVPNHPENHQTCIDFFGLFKYVFGAMRAPFPKGSKSSKPKDAESQVSKGSNPKDTESQAQGHHQMLPRNLRTCFEFMKPAFRPVLINLRRVFLQVSRAIRSAVEKKERHIWSLQLMDELLKKSSSYEHQNNGGKPQDGEDMKIPSERETTEDGQKERDGYKEIIAAINSLAKTMEKKIKPSPGSIDALESNKDSSTLAGAIIVKGDDETLPAPAIHDKASNNKRETAILMAARNGITEMVAKILEQFPVAIHDENSEKKNVVLLAVENRQPHVYSLLLEQKAMNDSIFRKVDKDGKSAQHLAARLGGYHPWKIPDAALQMQREIKWYKIRMNEMYT